MTDLRKAAEMALAALEPITSENIESALIAAKNARYFLRQALAQPEQEPVWCGCGDGIVADDGAKCGVCVMQLQNQIERLKAQPEQEPVAWEKSYDIACALLRQAHDILATTQYPIKRPWVSLTDEEMSDTYNRHYNDYVSNDIGIVDFIVIARAIEAQLKERNNG